MADTEPRHPERRDEEDLTDEDVRQRQIADEMGDSYANVTGRSGLKKKIYDFVYHPAAELFIFALIILSVVMLAIEVGGVEGQGGWMGVMAGGGGLNWFFWTDVAITVIFAIEYVTKLWLAPRKWYFVRHNIIDLLAILPVLRVMRIGRAVRLLRLFRLLRLVRVGRIVSQKVESVSAEFHNRTGENLVILIYILFSMFFGTIGILIFEKGAGSGFQTLGDGLWWTIVTLTTVGYGDITPVTTGGKLVATVLMFIGLSFYALLTSVLSSILIERAKKEEGAGMDVMGLVDHVVVCGWNPNGERLVRDLQASRPDTDIVIMSDREEIPRMLDDKIHYIIRDPTTEEALDKARVKHASVVVILSTKGGERNNQDADARSILTVLAVERLNPQVHTIVELNSEENIFHVENAGVDEIVVSEAYTGTMLSQAVQNPGVSDAFRDLFDTAKGSQLREMPIPEELVGEDFGEAMHAMYRDGKGVLVGYRRDDQVDLSPEKDVEFRLGDYAILMRAVPAEHE